MSDQVITWGSFLFVYINSPEGALPKTGVILTQSKDFATHSIGSMSLLWI